MLIDHIGVILFPEMQIFKIIGRISFPIFAFFVAEGWHYTKNRTKYVLTIAIFALITQPIYALIMNSSQLNILFTFLFAIALMYLIDKCGSMNIEHIVYLIVYLIVITFTSLLGIIDYDLLGILLPTIFYIFRNSNLKYAVSIGIIIIFSIIFSTIQLYSLIAILYPSLWALSSSNFPSLDTTSCVIFTERLVASFKQNKRSSLSFSLDGSRKRILAKSSLLE